MPVPKSSFKTVFKTIFHDKLSLDEFLNFNVNDHYQTIKLTKRVVYKASPQLKALHDFININILRYIQFNQQVVFSYRKGINVRDAVELHKDNKFFFQTDITNFYGSIDASCIEQVLISQLPNLPISDFHNYIQCILTLVSVDNQLPQGFMTSPQLSNSSLFSFDNELARYCKDNRLIYTRYSDDLIISSPTSSFSQNIQETITHLLQTNASPNLKLNENKTRLNRKGQNFKILGLRILPNGDVTTPSQKKKTIESMLYLFLKDKAKFIDYSYEKFFRSSLEKNQQETIYHQAIDKLSGQLNNCNSTNKEYIDKLRRKYGNTIIEMFIRKKIL